MEPVLSSFALVAISEMGDKTQLLAFSLTARYRKPWIVLLGILVATLLNHALASTFGGWIASHIQEKTLALILAVTFLAFAVWTLKPDTLDEEGSHTSRWGAFLSTAILFFIAETGDKTQLATVALGARYQSAVQVTVGTTVGMLLADGLAVFLGERLAKNFSWTWIRRLAAFLFALFGLASFWVALR